MEWRRPLVALALAVLAAWSTSAAPRGHAWQVRPDSLPASSSGPTIVSLLDAGPSAVHVIRSIAVDLDRDGDLDLVASTLEQPVVVWLQNAVGRFERQRPAGPVSLAGSHELSSPGDAAGIPAAAGAPRSRDVAQATADASAIDVASRLVRLEKTPGVFSLTPHSRHTRGPPPARLS